MSLYENTKKFADLSIDNQEKLNELDLTIERIVKLSENNAAVIINSTEFNALLQSKFNTNDPRFVPIVDNISALRFGHYVTFNNMIVVVKKEISPGEYKTGEDLDKIISLL
jgi:hypothetical protein